MCFVPLEPFRVHQFRKDQGVARLLANNKAIKYAPYGRRETSPNKVDAYHNEEVGVRWQKYLAKSEL